MRGDIVVWWLAQRCLGQWWADALLTPEMMDDLLGRLMVNSQAIITAGAPASGSAVDASGVPGPSECKSVAITAEFSSQHMHGKERLHQVPPHPPPPQLSGAVG